MSAAPDPPQLRPAGRAIEALYSDCSAARLYLATVRAVTESGYSIINSDSDTGTLSFRTGMSMKSWQGQEMTATVLTASPDHATIVIGGKRVTRGYQLQVYDWGEAAKIAGKLLERLTPIVAATPEPMSSAPESISTAEELERVARLYEQGVLTDEEFAAAKRKLLF